MENKSFFERLWERRFIQYTLSYIVGSWGLIQFIDWIVKRYHYASSWTDIALILFLTLLPSVLLFTYFHGRPGPDKWRPIEKVFIPFNIVLTIALIIFMFSGSDLGATATKVTVTNEEGETEQRLVPKSAFVKRVVLFPWENKIEAEEDDWMSLGLPILLDADLEQDNRIIVVEPQNLKGEFDNYGYPPGSKIPLSIQRKIAQDNYSDLFLSTAIEKTEDQYTVNATLYNAVDGKEFYQETYTGPDPLALIDEMTEDFRAKVYVRDTQDKRFVDLPASNLYSSSTEALRAFVQAVRLRYFENDLPGSIVPLQAAIEADPSFAMAHLQMCDNLFYLNQTDAAKASVQQAMKYKEALSERQQLSIKFSYQSFFSVDKAIALANMWCQLYPSDYKPYNLLMMIYRNRNDFNAAKAIGQKALENGHSGKLLLTLARLELLQGNEESALEYYERFAQEFPEQSKGFSGIGQVYMSMGEFEKAKEQYDKLIVMNPDDIKIMLQLSEIEGRLLNFEAEQAALQDAMRSAKSIQDSIKVMSGLEAYYAKTGRINQSIQQMQDRWAYSERIYPEQQVKSQLFFNFSVQRFVIADRIDEYQALANDYLQKYENPYANFGCVSDLNLSLFSETKPDAIDVMERCEEHFKVTIGPKGMLMVYAYYYKVIEDYPKALEYSILMRDSSGIDPGLMTLFGEIYRKNGDLDNSEASIKEFLKKQPDDGEQHYQLALTYHEMGKPSEAREEVELALKIWKDADPNFIPAQKARALAAELGG